jgi:hypothetical protein
MATALQSRRSTNVSADVPVRSIYIALEVEILDLLREYALRERRDMRDQAAIIIRQAVIEAQKKGLV